MFGDSFVIPHADGDITCVKINQDQYSSEYRFRDSTQQVTVKVRHSALKKPVDGCDLPPDRHNVELTQLVFATDTVAQIFRKVYIVVEQTPNDTDVKLVDAMADWLIASVNANITSLLQWES
jgi:hypothetical protein